jgi:O-antigen/teichoic acid export membrane protein
LITLLVLARMLSPADFGLTALAMTLVVIVETVLEVPLTQALTRLRRVGRAHLNTAFTLGVLRGLVLALVVLAAAWPFAALYHDDRLTPLVAALAAGPIARGLYNPAMVIFVRRISFRELFIAEFVGKLSASLIAIFVLYAGGGYWAIAANSTAAPITAAAVSYILAPFRPALSLSRLRDFSAFIGWFSVAQLISALNWQFDRLLLAQFTTKSQLGYYTIASDLAALPTQSLIGPAMSPVMAALSKVSTDHARLRSACLKALRLTMILAAPMCIGMSLTSDMIVDVLLSPKWEEAAIYLQWVALTITLNAYFQPLYSLALAVNRPSIVFRLNLIELCFRIVLVPCGLYLYSILGVIAARGAISLLMFAATVLSLKSLAGLSIATQIRNLWQIGVACCAMALSVLLLRRYLDALPNVPGELACTAAFGALAYVGTLFALGMRFERLRV